MTEHNPNPATKLLPGLYIVATPIGNLKDITLRALEVLAVCDQVLAEDTRVTNRLLETYGIKKPMYVYNDHSTDDVRNAVISAIESGKAVALVSDAGTPLISDPGFKLVRAVKEKGLFITTLPGASALTAAITLSGLPSDAVFFGGFLPSKENARAKTLKSLIHLEATLAFYERASRVIDTLAAIKEVLGEREVSIVREISKQYEEAIILPVSEQITRLQPIELKGEVVLLISPNAENVSISEDDIKTALTELLKTHRLKEAAEIVATRYSLPKRDVYQLGLELGKDG